MSTARLSSPLETLADLVDRLGGIPLDRIRYDPRPGTASVDDVIRIEEQGNRLCELVEGVLVEKMTGFKESLLAMAIGQYLRSFVTPSNLGLVAGADGMMRLFADLVRIPDVAFVSWDRLPDGRVPDDPVPMLVPNLVVEVLSRSNTKAEMKRKRDEYFEAGVDLVWIVDPESRTVAVFASAADACEFTERESLDGAPVLPGFSLSLADLFAELDRRAD